MRTTIDLPDDLHRLALSMSRDLGLSLSATVTGLMRRGLRPDAGTAAASEVRIVDGFPLIRLGRATTSEDVRALEDEGLE